jgi:hypothetical protein
VDGKDLIGNRTGPRRKGYRRFGRVGVNGKPVGAHLVDRHDDAGDGIGGFGGDLCFTAGSGDPVGIDDDPTVGSVLRGEEHELDAPGVSPVPSKCRPASASKRGAQLPGAAVQDPGVGPVPEQRGDDLAVGVEQPDAAGLVDGAAPVDVSQPGENCGG